MLLLCQFIILSRGYCISLDHLIPNVSNVLLYNYVYFTVASEACEMVKSFEWILLVIVLGFLTNERTAVSTIRKSLYFQLVVSQSERFDFSGYIPAVDVALRLINSNASILSDYELKYTDIIDAKVSY